MEKKLRQYVGKHITEEYDGLNINFKYIHNFVKVNIEYLYMHREPIKEEFSYNVNGQFLEILRLLANFNDADCVRLLELTKE